MNEKTTERMSISACIVVAIILIVGAVLVSCDGSTNVSAQDTRKSLLDTRSNPDRVIWYGPEGKVVFEKPLEFNTWESGHVFMRIPGKRIMFYQNFVTECDD